MLRRYTYDPYRVEYTDRNRGKRKTTKQNPSPKGKKVWSEEEDMTLKQLVKTHGTGNWTIISQNLPNRTGKQCRERFHNHLDVGIKKGDWTDEEDRIIIVLQRNIGNQWAKITKLLPGRTDNAVKNRFHATERAKLREKFNDAYYDDPKFRDYILQEAKRVNGELNETGSRSTHKSTSLPMKSNVPVIPNDSALMNTPPLKDTIHSRSLHLMPKNIPSTVSVVSSNSSIDNTISTESEDNYTIQSSITTASPTHSLFQFSFDEEETLQPLISIDKKRYDTRTISDDEIQSVNDLMGIDIISFDEEDYYDKMDSSMIDIDPGCFDKSLNKISNTIEQEKSNYKSQLSNYGQPIKKMKVKSVSPNENKSVMFSPTAIKSTNLYKKKDSSTFY